MIPVYLCWISPDPDTGERKLRRGMGRVGRLPHCRDDIETMERRLAQQDGASDAVILSWSPMARKNEVPFTMN
jgi:hypothetical protein